ncbi:MAG: MBL fold metallo-hydrolase [Hyphomicrobiales bacterium]|nr:MBL fold metallo-hydrolase [Hyphomicrobiales bacterium]MCP5370381.1 MBL fold metallo-hydrolase [Hyphomicrobiales bacterium]
MELDYPFEQPDGEGTLREIDDGLFWVRMPLPFPPRHINLWLLRDGDGWTVVDTGIGRPEVQAHWRRILDEVTGGRPVRRAIVTHFHPDHLGNAGWFARHHGSRLWMTQEEWLMGRLLAADTSEATTASNVDFFRHCDLDEDNIFEFKARGWQYKNMVESIPRQFVRMYDGDAVHIGGDVWRVIVGRGHAPEHACLHSAARRILISGDQILPRITPIVGVPPMEPEANPLQDFLDSLAKFEHLEADTLVLPAHGLPFRGLPGRLAATRVHHEERLETLRAACAQPLTVRRAVDAMFDRALDPQNLRLASAETLSHLNLLVARGQVVREDGDGPWHFRSR